MSPRFCFKFYFGDMPIWLAHCTKNMKLWRLPKNRRLYFEVCSSFPLAQLYRWKEDTIFQDIWDKSEVVWRTCWGKHCEIGKHIGNPLGTSREHSVNTLGSREIWKKIPHTPPPPNIKGKKASHLECMLGPCRWLHEISLPKRLGHHFWPGLTPLAKNTLPIQCWGTFDFLNINCPVFQTFQI